MHQKHNTCFLKLWFIQKAIFAPVKDKSVATLCLLHTDVRLQLSLTERHTYQSSIRFQQRYRQSDSSSDNQLYVSAYATISSGQSVFLGNSLTDSEARFPSK